jgi:hypothetical protein
VQGRDAFGKKVFEERELQQVDMEMDDVEFIGPPKNLLQHHQRTSRVVPNAREA